MTTGNWAVFLDRDGVLTHAPVTEGKAMAPTHVRDLVVVAGAVEAVAALKNAGALIFVVTNQPDVARGTLDPGQLHLMHELLRSELAVDDIAVCPHDGRDNCACRKPRPGMLISLARQWNCDLAESYMVGDRWVDIAAGAAAGCTTVLVRFPYSWTATSAGTPSPLLRADHLVCDVLEAAAVVLRDRPPRSTHERAL